MGAEVYYALLLNSIEPEIEKIFRKNKNCFRRNRSTTSQILTIRWIIGVYAENLEATLLFIDFSKVFNSIHREKMELILLAYGLPKETVTATMMLNRNTKVKVCSTGERHRFLRHSCWSSVRRYISAIAFSNLPRLRTSNVDRSNKRKWFYTKKGQKQTISRKNFNRRRQCRWHSASCKYTYPSRIHAAQPGAGSKRHWSPHESKRAEYVF